MVLPCRSLVSPALPVGLSVTGPKGVFLVPKAEGCKVRLKDFTVLELEGSLDINSRPFHLHI